MCDNGKVYFSDFLRLAGNFGNSNATHAQGDLNADGSVGIEDFLRLAENFGETLPSILSEGAVARSRSVAATDAIFDQADVLAGKRS